MRWPKIDANRVSNLNRIILSRIKITCQKGVSLVELMVAVGVSSVILLAAGTLMIFVTDSFTMIIEKDESETSLMSAAYALRTIATQAVNLQVVNAAGGISATPATGQIIDTFDSTAAANGALSELAVFYREGSDGADTSNSLFYPTGLFFKNPINTDSGQFIIVSRKSHNGDFAGNIFDNAAAPQAFVNPDPNEYQGLIFDRMTAVTMVANRVNTAGSNYARDARITLRVKYKMRPDVNFSYILGNNMGQVKSLEVYVGFRNNYLGPSQLKDREAERLHGSLYYFPFVNTFPGI